MKLLWVLLLVCCISVVSAQPLYQQIREANCENDFFEVQYGELTDESKARLLTVINNTGDSALVYLDNLTCLRYLNLSHTHINTLDYLPFLHKLRFFSISYTSIESIDEHMGKFPSLQRLDIRNTLIEDIPDYSQNTNLVAIHINDDSDEGSRIFFIDSMALLENGMYELTPQEKIQIYEGLKYVTWFDYENKKIRPIEEWCIPGQELLYLNYVDPLDSSHTAEIRGYINYLGHTQQGMYCSSITQNSYFLNTIKFEIETHTNRDMRFYIHRVEFYLFNRLIRNEIVDTITEFFIILMGIVDDFDLYGFIDRDW